MGIIGSHLDITSDGLEHQANERAHVSASEIEAADVQRNPRANHTRQFVEGGCPARCSLRWTPDMVLISKSTE
jgi:hypothetical protein